LILPGKTTDTTTTVAQNGAEGMVGVAEGANANSASGDGDVVA